jgi:hypothetical protein
LPRSCSAAADAARAVTTIVFPIMFMADFSSG